MMDAIFGRVKKRMGIDFALPQARGSIKMVGK